MSHTAIHRLLRLPADDHLCEHRFCHESVVGAVGFVGFANLIGLLEEDGPNTQELVIALESDGLQRSPQFLCADDDLMQQASGMSL